MALQDLDTDDIEGCEFSKKFRAESSGDMQKLMACVGHWNHSNYSKTQLLCLIRPYKSKVAGFRVVWMILVSETYH